MFVHLTKEEQAVVQEAIKTHMEVMAHGVRLLPSSARAAFAPTLKQKVRSMRDILDKVSG